MVKASKYNILFNLNGNSYILYNTLYNSIARIDKDLFIKISKNMLEDIPQDIQSKLYKFHFLVNDDLNEIDVIKTLRTFEISRLYSASRVGLTLTMTYACNLRCPYCYEGTLTERAESMSKQDIDIILKFALNHKYYFQPKQDISFDVTFYGGEPLLNWTNCKYTLKSLEALKQRNKIKDYTAGFVTNGTLINDEVINAINKFNIISMQITLDGPKEIHDSRRVTKAGHGTFDLIISNIKRILSHVTNEKFHLGIRINVDKTNIDTIPELLDSLVSEGITSIDVSFGIIRSNIDGSWYDKTLRGEELRKYLPRLWKEAYKRGFNVQTRPNHRLLFCMYAHPFSYVVDPSRKLYPCWEMVGQEEYSIGKISDEGTLDITPFYYTVKARMPTEFKECRNCVFLPVCGGGCPMESIRKNGTPNGPGCYLTRYLWKEGLKFYLAKTYPHLFPKNELFNILGRIPDKEERLTTANKLMLLGEQV